MRGFFGEFAFRLLGIILVVAALLFALSGVFSGEWVLLVIAFVLLVLGLTFLSRARR